MGKASKRTRCALLVPQPFRLSSCVSWARARDCWVVLRPSANFSPSEQHGVYARSRRTQMNNLTPLAGLSSDAVDNSRRRHAPPPDQAYSFDF
jgi:hypothetical protein